VIPAPDNLWAVFRDLKDQTEFRMRVVAFSDEGDAMVVDEGSAYLESVVNEDHFLRLEWS